MKNKFAAAAAAIALVCTSIALPVTEAEAGERNQWRRQHHSQQFNQHRHHQPRHHGGGQRRNNNNNDALIFGLGVLGGVIANEMLQGQGGGQQRYIPRQQFGGQHFRGNSCHDLRRQYYSAQDIYRQDDGIIDRQESADINRIERLLVRKGCRL